MIGRVFIFSWKKVESLRRVHLFVTEVYQAPPFMRFFLEIILEWVAVSFPSIFPTQGWNPDLLHCRQTLYHLSHQGIPYFSLVKLKTWMPRKRHWKEIPYCRNNSWIGGQHGDQVSLFYSQFQLCIMCDYFDE